MENQPELIRQEMQQTRTALTEKLEALEQRVLGTVQTATCAVQDTVTTVKDSIEGTVHTVKESIGETVGTVKQTFDLELQVQRHPWAMVGSALCAGYVGGLVVQQLSAPPASVTYLPGSAAPAHRTDDGWSERHQTAAERPAPPAPAGEAGWADSLRTKFEPEIDKLKGVAIGAVFNVVKGLLHSYLPRSVEPQVCEMVDSVTRKMGGKPVQGSILEELHSSVR